MLKLVRLDDGRWLVAIVKRTADRSRLFVTSYRIQSASALKRLLAGTRIVYDRR